jgi:hypothetical protein
MLAAIPLLAACQEPPPVNAGGSLNSPPEVGIEAPQAAESKVDVLAQVPCFAYYVSFRVRALVGGDDQKVAPNKRYVYGNGGRFPVRLTVAEVAATGERVVFETEGSFPLTSWGDDSFGKVVMGGKRLLPGLYRVRMDVLSDSPAYTGTPVKLSAKLKC